ncbi:MAG: lytic transglycosylase domain-containing protein [Treponema sp.]|nr:lytic transglycosylase domain-containing protein [Treponema sp.]
MVCCGAGRSVLDLPLHDAKERLEKGEIAFILAANASRVKELRELNSPAVFYAGLLAGESSPSHEAALFALALDGSPLIREQAAAKLIPLVLAGGAKGPAESLYALLADPKRPAPEAGSQAAALMCAVSFVLGRFEESAPPEELPLKAAGNEKISAWEGVLRLAGSLTKAGMTKPDGAEEQLAALLFSAPAGAVDRWVYGQDGSSPVPGFPDAFGQAEYAALAGRLAVSRQAYEEALTSFRTVIAQKRSLFFRYPQLLNDLGRAFQFSSAGAEGAALFIAWDRFFAGEFPAEIPAEFPADVPPGENGPVRYRLHYFAGRIERQLGASAKAEEHFTRALEFAPDPVQKDACIWYILDTAQSRGRAKGGAFWEKEFVPLLRRFIPQWRDTLYFEDILDRLSRTLVSGRRWDTLQEVFSLLRKRAGGGGSIAARYAYILGRAVQEGYLPAVQPAEELFKIARDEGGAAFYYRALASSRLGTEIAIDAPPPEDPENFPHREAVEFLLGFFRFGAGQFVGAYLRDFLEELSPGELRALAEAFSAAGRWAESIRTVGAYLFQEGYTANRRDLELYHPRPFRDLVEARAEENMIPAAALYGLIHTESAFEPDSRSRVGAVGLTQLMPATAEEMAGRIRRQGGPDYTGGEAVLTDPAVNIHLGAYYLRYLVNLMENPMLAVLAYNGGLGRIRRLRAAEPRLAADLFPETLDIDETRNYGRKVLGAAAVYGYLYYTVTMESVLADIYSVNR